MTANLLPAEPPSIDTLIERCLRGDQLAWEAVVRQHWRKVFNVAYKFVGSHEQAEDLTQDIFLKIFRSLETFDRRANFQTWLISVSRNLCIDYYRSVRRERQLIDRELRSEEMPAVSRTVSPLKTLENRDLAAELRQALQGLPSSLRTAVLLRDIHELSYQEIADRLKLPEGTVKSRINRGRRELARRVQRLRAEANRPARMKGNGGTGVTPGLGSGVFHEPDD